MFPNKKESILMLFALWALEVFTVILLGIAGVHWDESDPAMYIIVSMFSTSAIVWFSLARMGLKFEQLFHGNQNNLVSLITITAFPLIMVTVGSHILLSNYLNLYSIFFPNETSMTNSISLMMGRDVLGFLSVCLIAPIIEELVFRGIILRGLLANYSKSSAILFSSILFSLFHINPDQLVHALVFGLFLGWLYLKTFSLWPSIIAHVLLNTVAYIMGASLIHIEGINYFPNNEITFPSVFIQLVGMGLTFSGLFLLNSMFTLRKAS